MFHYSIIVHISCAVAFLLMPSKKRKKRGELETLLQSGGAQQRKRLEEALLTDKTAQPKPNSALAEYLALGDHRHLYRDSYWDSILLSESLRRVYKKV